jgi:transketolase
MRTEFLTGLADLADADPRIVLLTADLGFGSIEVFADRHPNRFINVGVSEQNMVGLATGLAEAGLVPYCYSIAAFSVARTFEFLRNGPVSHQLPVRLVGIGPGMDYSFDGLTHYALEDISLLANQPNSMIVAPSNARSAFEFGRSGIDFSGLVYYRLARQGAEIEFQTGPDPQSSVIPVIAFGDAAQQGALIAESLAMNVQVAPELIQFQVLSPESLRQLATNVIESRSTVVVTVENHYVMAGFGSLLQSQLSDLGWKGDVIKWGVTTAPTGTLGSLEYMVSKHCPSTSDIVDKVLKSIRSGTELG